MFTFQQRSLVEFCHFNVNVSFLDIFSFNQGTPGSCVPPPLSDKRCLFQSRSAESLCCFMLFPSLSSSRSSLPFMTRMWHKLKSSRTQVKHLLHKSTVNGRPLLWSPGYDLAAASVFDACCSDSMLCTMSSCSLSSCCWKPIRI